MSKPKPKHLKAPLEMPSQPPPSREVAALCVGLAAITFAVFGQTVGFGFVNFDDDVYVSDNARVAGGLSLKGLAWVFTHPDCHLYHPLTMLSLMANYQLHGLHPGGYHLTNVLVHAGSAILLFLVLHQMTGALWRSAFVAAVFAVHPLRVESVAWVAERKDVLGAFFFMVTLAAYVRYVRAAKSTAPYHYLAVAVAFVLALLSKPTVVTLPFVLLLLDYWPLRRFEPPGAGLAPKCFGIPRRLLVEKIPLIALAAAACLATLSAETDQLAARANVSLPARVGNAAVAYVVYLRQMLWPAGLAPYYPEEAKGYRLWVLGGAFLVLALITAVVLAFRRRHGWLLTGWFWYAGMLTPMIGLVQVVAFAHADRNTYLPQIGLYLLLTWAVGEVSAAWPARSVALGGLAVAVLLPLMACAFIQTTYWRDNQTLWNHALACTTGNDVAHNNLGFAVMKKGNMDEAITHFQAALQCQPRNAQAQNNLGSAFAQKGKLDAAAACFRKALQISARYPQAHYNLGRTLLLKGEVNEAVAEYRKALEAKPDYADAHINLGLILFQQGKVDEAIAQYREALAWRPDHANGHDNLGFALMRAGNVDEAIRQFQQALLTEPTNVNVHNNLGTALLHRGRAEEAISHYLRALAIQADSADARYGLGNALLQQGKMADAIAQYQQSLQLKPGNPEVQNNLAWVLATCPEASLRNGQRALELARQANELTGGASPIVLHTLAAAFAELGQFDDARRSVQKAIEAAPAAGRQDLAGQLNDELKRYEASLPAHD